MIQIKAAKTPCGRWFFSSQGHADVEPGEINRICAAASMLSYTLLDYLTRLDERKVSADIRDGTMSLVFADSPSSRGCLDVVLTGYDGLAYRYPEQIQLDIKQAVTPEPVHDRAEQAPPEPENPAVEVYACTETG